MTAEERDEEWARRVKPSRKNRAKNLYADFEFRWRFWKIVLLIQKLLLVVIVMFTVDYPAVCASLMCLNHALMCLFTLYAMPYMDKRPDLLAISISFANFFNTLLAAMAFAQIVVPEGIWWGVMFVNLPLPILMFLTGWCPTSASACRRPTPSTPPSAAARTGTRCRIKLPKEAGSRAIERRLAAARRRVELDQRVHAALPRLVDGGRRRVLVPRRRRDLDRIVCREGDDAGAPALHRRRHPSTVVDCEEEFATEAEFIGFNTWDNRTTTAAACGQPERVERERVGHADLKGSSSWRVDRRARPLPRQRPDADGEPQPPKITYKERVRRNTHDGTFVRPFCASEFDAGNVSLGAPPIYIAPYWNGTMYGVLLGEADNVTFVAELW